ncbi:amidase family protein [Aspergillus luchuensis]|uniref:Amidase family protein n=1 Tax=Aspergillus kawachii TaxID=1069201 RepID=A0A146F4R1_ASPKA|nr:amidase family protein [Aspergillus luchuensis]
MDVDKKDIEDVLQPPEYVHDDVFGEISEHGQRVRYLHTEQDA